MQSRFLALVSNGDELRKNIETAENAENTGTIQYLESLDSLESKLNQLQVAYQQFYTSIGVENVWKKAVDGIRNFVENLNDLPKAFGKIPVAALGVLYDAITLIRSFGQSLIGEIGNAFMSNISATITPVAAQAGEEGGQTFKASFEGAVQKIDIKDKISGVFDGLKTTVYTFKESILSVRDSIGGVFGLSKQNTEIPTVDISSILDTTPMKIEDSQRRYDAVIEKVQQLQTIIQQVNNSEIRISTDQLKEAEEQVKNLQDKLVNFLDYFNGAGVDPDAWKNAVNENPSSPAPYADILHEANTAADALNQKLQKTHVTFLTTPNTLNEKLQEAQQEAQALQQQIEKAMQQKAPDAAIDGLNQKLQQAKERCEELKASMAGLQSIRSSLGGLGSALRILANFIGTGTTAATQLSGALMTIAGTLSIISAIGKANPWTAIVMGIISIYSGIDRWIITDEEKLEQLQKKAEELSNTAKQEKSNYKIFKESKEELEELEKQRYDSAEAAEEYQTAVDKLAETYPQLITGLDEAGNAAIEAANLDFELEKARRASAQATLTAVNAEIDAKKGLLNTAKEKSKKAKKGLSNYTKDHVGVSNNTIENLITDEETYKDLLGFPGVGPAWKQTDIQQFTNSLVSNLEAVLELDFQASSSYDESTGSRVSDYSKQYGFKAIFDENQQWSFQITDLEQFEQQLEATGLASYTDLITYFAKIDDGLDDKVKNLFAILEDDTTSEEAFNNVIAELTELGQLHPQLLGIYQDCYDLIKQYNESEIEAADLQSQLDALDKQAVSSKIQLQKSELFEQLGDLQVIFTNYLSSVSEDMFDSQLNELEQEWNSLGYYLQQQFQEKWKNRTQYTTEDLIEFLDIDENDPFAQAIQAYYEENNMTGKWYASQLKKQMEIKFNRGNTGLFVDSDLNKLYVQISEVQSKITTEFSGWISQMINLIQDYQSRGLTTNASNLAAATANVLSGLSDLDETELIIARSIIATNDLTNVSGVQTTLTALEDAGIKNDALNKALEGLEDSLVYNIPLAITSYTENLTSQLDDFEKSIKNLNSGLSFSEAMEALNKINNVLPEDSTKYSLKDLQQKKGKLYFKNDELLTKYVEALSDKLDTTELDAINKRIEDVEHISLEEDKDTITELKEFADQSPDQLVNITGYEEIFPYLESLGIATGIANESGNITQMKIDVGELKKLGSGNLVEAIVKNFEGQLTDAQEMYNYAENYLLAQYQLEAGNYTNYFKKLFEGRGTELRTSYADLIRDVASGREIGTDIGLSYEDVKAAKDKINETWKNFIDDALDKGIENLNFEDYDFGDTMNPEVFSEIQDKWSGRLVEYLIQNTNYVIDMMGLSLEEANDYIVKAIEQDKNKQFDITDALKNINFTGQGYYGSLDDIQKIADAAGMSITQLLGTYSSELDAWTIDSDALNEAIEGVEGAAELLSDSLRSFLEELAKSIGEAMDGITESEKNELFTKLESIGLNTDFIEALTFEHTIDGLKLSTASAQQLVIEISKVDAIAGRLTFNELYDSLTATGSGLETITATTGEIARIEREIAQNNKEISEAIQQGDDAGNNRAAQLEQQNEELREQLSLLRQIQMTQSADADSYKFMDQKLPEGLQGPENYWNAVGKAYSAMSDASSTGYMEIQDFYNIVNEMNNIASISGTTLEFMGQSLSGKAEDAAALIEQGLGALSNVDGEGVKIDFSKLAAQIGTGADSMSDGFDDAIHTMAQSQIDMLDAMIQLLETIVAMEKLSDIDIDNDNKLDLGEIFKLDNNNNATDFTDKYKKWLEENITNNEELQPLLEKFSINGHTLAQLFTSDFEAWKDVGLSEEQFQQILQSLYNAALSGDYDLDNLMSSIMDILAATGQGEVYEATLDDGRKVAIGYNTTLESNKDGKYFVQDHEYSTVDEALNAQRADDIGAIIKETKRVTNEDGTESIITESTLTLGKKIINVTTTDGENTYQSNISGVEGTFTSIKDLMRAEFAYEQSQAEAAGSEGWGSLEEYVEANYGVNIAAKYLVDEIKVTNKEDFQNRTQKDVNELAQALVNGDKQSVVNAAEKIGIDVDVEGELTAEQRQQIAELAGIESRTVALNIATTIDGEGKEILSSILENTEIPDAEMNLNIHANIDGNGAAVLEKNPDLITNKTSINTGTKSNYQPDKLNRDKAAERLGDYRLTSGVNQRDKDVRETEQQRTFDAMLHMFGQLSPDDLNGISDKNKRLESIREDNLIGQAQWQAQRQAKQQEQEQYYGFQSSEEFNRNPGEVWDETKTRELLINPPQLEKVEREVEQEQAAMHYVNTDQLDIINNTDAFNQFGKELGLTNEQLQRMAELQGDLKAANDGYEQAVGTDAEQENYENLISSAQEYLQYVEQLTEELGLSKEAFQLLQGVVPDIQLPTEKNTIEADKQTQKEKELQTGVWQHEKDVNTATQNLLTAAVVNPDRDLAAKAYEKAQQIMQGGNFSTISAEPSEVYTQLIQNVGNYNDLSKEQQAIVAQLVNSYASLKRVNADASSTEEQKTQALQDFYTVVEQVLPIITELGNSVDEGLSTAIAEGIGTVTASTTNLANEGIVTPLNEVIRKGSPSEMAIEFGQSVVEGLVEGMNDTASVDSAAQALAQVIVTGLQTILAGTNLGMLFSTLGTGTLNLNPIAQNNNSNKQTETVISEGSVEEASLNGATIDGIGIIINAEGAQITGNILSNSTSEPTTSVSSTTPQVAQSTTTAQQSTEQTSATPTIDFSALQAGIAIAQQSLGTLSAQFASVFSRLKTSAGNATTQMGTLATKIAALKSKSLSISATITGTIKANISATISATGAPTTTVTVPENKTTISKSSAKGNVALAKGVAASRGVKSTLMGELGPELVVSDGRYYTVGENGAEFVNLPNDAIIFNHQQTEKLLKHRKISGRGDAVNGERAALSFAKGTEGPAQASASAALSQLKQIRAMWQSLLNASASDMGKKGGGGGTGGGGGGSGADDAAYVKELEVWYNLLQQIAELEREISHENQLQAKLESDRVANGKQLYQSYKDSINYLDQEVSKNQELADLQKSMYDAYIEQYSSSPLSQVLTFSENGTPQYNNSLNDYINERIAANKASGWSVNEKTGAYSLSTTYTAYERDQYTGELTDAGKKAASGASSKGKSTESLSITFDEGLTGLELLSELQATDKNGKYKYTADEQYAILKSLGFEDMMAITKSGKEADTNQERVQAFFDKLDAAQSEAESLYDSYQEQQNKVLENQAKINEYLTKLRENQIEVQKSVLDAVEAKYQKEIDLLEDEKDALKDATDEFIDGLNEQLEREQKMYQDQQEDQELVKLQRQLAILQRSGGSASQIKSLQDQITSKQQDKYFNSQQDQIDAIQDASDRQIEQMEKQIDLMQETLDYQKEHGLLWDEVSQIMAGTEEDILTFITTYNEDFAKNSAEQIHEDLLDLSKKVGEWVAERDDESSPEKTGTGTYTASYERGWETLKRAGSFSDEAYSKSESAAKQAYLNVMNSDNGDDTKAYEAMKAVVEKAQEEIDASKKAETKEEVTETAAITKTLSKDRDWYSQATSSSKKKSNKLKKGTSVTVLGANYTKQKYADKLKVHYYLVEANGEKGWLNGDYISLTDAEKKKLQNYIMSGKQTPAYASGGLIDYTGPAWVDGSRSNPESILSASDTQFVREEAVPALTNALVELQSISSSWTNLMSNIIKDNISEPTIYIESANVNMNVEQMANDYDAAQAANTVMEEMLRIARKSCNRSISRR